MSAATSGATDETRPVLSVVVTARDELDDPGAVFERLFSGSGQARCEFILSDGRVGGAVPPEMAGIRHLSFPGLSMPDLKARGVAEATADSVAFLEAKSVPGSGWLDAALASLARHPGALLGGPVVFAGTPDAANRAAYAFEYAAFTRERVTDSPGGDLPGCNMILPRPALLAGCADILDSMGLNKPFCQERLKAAGHPVILVPELATELRSHHRLWPLLVTRNAHGRCFGGRRAALAPRSRRFAYRFLGPAVAPMLLVRHQCRLGGAGLGPPSAATRAVVALLALSWALGEWTGALFGPGRSCEQVH